MIYNYKCKRKCVNIPPKAKFSREEIIEVALDIVRKKGIRALTARELGSALGSSARPIFTAFQNMEEVQAAVIKAAKEIYWSYIANIKDFRDVGIQYVHFAKKEPKLFHLIFMAEDIESSQLENELDGNKDFLFNNLDIIKEQFHMDTDDAVELWEYFWVFGHGIATLTTTKFADFSDEKIMQMFYNLGIALMPIINNKKKDQ